MSSSKILSDNGVSSGTSGIIAGGGNDGTLLLQTTTAGGAATTAITIDTSQNVTFAKPFSKIISITASVASNALTVTLNPCALDFRSSTLGSGTVNTRTVSSAISMTVSSGSTLGTVNAIASRIVVLAIDNAGTIELAVVNVASDLVLDETGLISTTAVGGAGGADSATVIYSTTARSSVAYRVIGYIESTQATAGTWATAPSAIQGVGGKEIVTSRITTSATVATTSGTSIDVTGIPPWAKRIIVIFNGVSTSGTSNKLVQIGSGSVQTTGYVSTGISVNTGGGIGGTSSTIGYLISSQVAADTLSGNMCIINISSSIYISNHVVKHSTSQCAYGGGDVTLSGTLDRVRITTVNGTDTFDAGSIMVTWE